MRILVIGATGTIGSAVVKALAGSHDIVAVAHTKGDRRVDLASLARLHHPDLPGAGRCDAVVSAAGSARFAGLADLTEDDYLFGLKNKLMGQVNLIRIGQAFLNDGGSFTVTSGVLSQEPMRGGSISMVNAALEGFVRAAALELPRGLRINVVSPPWVTETLLARGMDPSIGLPADIVGRVYVRSAEGSATGQTIDPRTLPR